MANRGSKRALAVLFVVGIAVIVMLSMLTAADMNVARLADQPRVDVVLDLPYGSGSGSVGATKVGEPDTSAPPYCPEMFQMTSDGTLWVLDTVNSRVLAFKDGKQSAEISTLELKKRPSLFGVTRDAVWIKKAANLKEKGPVFSLLRYDRISLAWETVKLELPGGAQLDPLRIMPLGAQETALLITGMQYPADIPGSAVNASIVLDQKGNVVAVQQDGTSIPAADASVWRFRATDTTLPAELPFVLDKYNSQSEKWETVAQGALPRRAELSRLREKALTLPVGMDEQGRAVVILFEGKPLSQRFIRIAPSGAVANAVTLEELGYDSAPLGKYFAASHYQVLPDGSVLAQYANPERYRIIRIYF
ncbi:MAG TPA: hypothetical protein VMX94_01985 [Armatimonadota bacterium]|nr:hypothetical protein [Armatimonadota bacterium]